jgi:hypothetical protein
VFRAARKAETAKKPDRLLGRDFYDEYVLLKDEMLAE